MPDMKSSLPLLVFVTGILLASCGSQVGQRIEAEELFSLSFGILEDNLNAFAFQDVAPNLPSTITMRNGIFAVADGPSNKVMEFTAYGDLLGLIYDPEENPPPITLRRSDELANSGLVVNKQAHPYSFQRVGSIVYDRQNQLLVQDSLPPARKIFDEQRGVYLNHVVLRFDSDGNYKDYIGQEGIGGTAFPFIQSLQNTIHDNLVVVSRSTGAWQVFWYNPEGDLRYRVEFEPQHLPRLENSDRIPILDTVQAHPFLPYLILKVDFYNRSISGESQTDHSVVSRVYWFELASATYSAAFDLPVNVQNRGALNPGSSTSVQYLYEFLGIDERGVMFFLSRITEIQHQLIMMNSEGRVTYRGFIELDDGSMLLRRLHVSGQGILVGLLVYEQNAKVVWWRTDKVEGRSN